MKRRPTIAEQTTADLFGFGTSYPALPGHRGKSETSREAAEAIAPFAANVRGRVAALIAETPSGLTPDEAASRLGLTPFSVRPRFTELAAAGLIEKTGERRANATSTMKAAVWRATPLLLPAIDSPPLAFYCPGDGQGSRG